MTRPAAVNSRPWTPSSPDGDAPAIAVHAHDSAAVVADHDLAARAVRDAEDVAAGRRDGRGRARARIELDQVALGGDEEASAPRRLEVARACDLGHGRDFVIAQPEDGVGNAIGDQVRAVRLLEDVERFLERHRGGGPAAMRSQREAAPRRPPHPARLTVKKHQEHAARPRTYAAPQDASCTLAAPLNAPIPDGRSSASSPPVRARERGGRGPARHRRQATGPLRLAPPRAPARLRDARDRRHHRQGPAPARAVAADCGPDSRRSAARRPVRAPRRPRSSSSCSSATRASATRRAPRRCGSRGSAGGWRPSSSQRTPPRRWRSTPRRSSYSRPSAARRPARSRGRGLTTSSTTCTRICSSASP